jgi:hypothetical protein
MTTNVEKWHFYAFVDYLKTLNQLTQQILRKLNLSSYAFVTVSL